MFLRAVKAQRQARVLEEYVAMRFAYNANEQQDKEFQEDLTE
jgi:hypothetical protein